ncbi:hypothetical protein PPYR_12129 [Photinus pyralis]|uniref:Intraflagellar transport protein 20 homolog n=1 Tax=Photinus pyralis TaxID=7054 RepID=A0A5N4AD87_PHOPY|nr:intraflagellar transport protein 20 homolog [Photinus pyralis]KAB0795290.1 hypothetical protein PPYR_12129 [Photinus pyralis]
MDNLSKLGIYFDEIDKVRILEPEVSNQTNDLKEECKIYVEKISEFQKISDGFLSITTNLANEVEKQKMKAIGARNLLQSMTKEKEAQCQQLQALISEKSMELERLKVQLTSLQKIEMEQNEIINRLTHSQ